MDNTRRGAQIDPWLTISIACSTCWGVALASRYALAPEVMACNMTSSLASGPMTMSRTSGRSPWMVPTNGSGSLSP